LTHTSLQTETFLKPISWLAMDKNSSGDEIANMNFYAVARKLPEFAKK